MASGTIALSTNNYLTGRIVWSSTTNISSNTSSVTAILQIRKTNSFITYGQMTCTLTIGSHTDSLYVNWSTESQGVGSSWKEVGRKTYTISHNSNGTGSVYLYAKVPGFGGTSTEGANISGSQTVALDTIPRTNSFTVSAPNGTSIGDNTSILITKASSSFTTTLTYSLGSISGTIATKTSGTSVNWTIPTSLYQGFTSSKSAVITIKAETFSGSTSTGSISKTMTIYAVEGNCKPGIGSINITHTGQGQCLQGVDNATLVFSISPKNYASITSVTINGEPISYTNLNSISKTYSPVSTSSYLIKVTDSRGYTNQQNVTIDDYIEYIKPSITYYNVERINKTSIKLTGIRGTVYSNSNQLLIQSRYRIKNGTYGNYTTLATISSLSNNSFNISSSYTIASSVSENENYEVELRIGDQYNQTATKVVEVLKVSPVFAIGKDKVLVKGLLKGGTATFSGNVGVGNTLITQRLLASGTTVLSGENNNGWIGTTSDPFPSGCFKNLSVNGIDVSLEGHVHSASNITSGTLPVSRGGTGTTTSKGNDNTPVYLSSSALKACSGNTIATESWTVTTANTTKVNHTVPGQCLALLITMKGSINNNAMSLVVSRQGNGLSWTFPQYGQLNNTTETWPMAVSVSQSSSSATVSIGRASGTATIYCYCTALYTP